MAYLHGNQSTVQYPFQDHVPCAHPNQQCFHHPYVLAQHISQSSTSQLPLQTAFYDSAQFPQNLNRIPFAQPSVLFSTAHVWVESRFARCMPTTVELPTISLNFFKYDAHSNYLIAVIQGTPTHLAEALRIYSDRVQHFLAGSAPTSAASFTNTQQDLEYNAETKDFADDSKYEQTENDEDAENNVVLFGSTKKNKNESENNKIAPRMMKTSSENNVTCLVSGVENLEINSTKQLNNHSSSSASSSKSYSSSSSSPSTSSSNCLPTTSQEKENCPPPASFIPQFNSQEGHRIRTPLLPCVQHHHRNTNLQKLTPNYPQPRRFSIGLSSACTAANFNILVNKATFHLLTSCNNIPLKMLKWLTHASFQVAPQYLINISGSRRDVDLGARVLKEVMIFIGNRFSNWFHSTQQQEETSEIPPTSPITNGSPQKEKTEEKIENNKTQKENEHDCCNGGEKTLQVILMDEAETGKIIGYKGENIRKIERESGAFVQMTKINILHADRKVRAIFFVGPIQFVLKARQHIIDSVRFCLTYAPNESFQ